MLINGRTRAIEHCGETNVALAMWCMDINPSDVHIVDVGPDETILCPLGWYHAVQYLEGGEDGEPAINIDIQYTHRSNVPRSLLPANFCELDGKPNAGPTRSSRPGLRAASELLLGRICLQIATALKYRSWAAQTLPHLYNTVDVDKTYAAFLQAIEGK